MAREIKYGQAYARYLASDGVTVATQTCATTSAIPKNAIITATTVISNGVIDSASNNATITIIAGGVTTTSALTEANLIAAGYVQRETVVATADSTSDGTDIKVAVGTAALTGGTADLDIIVEYLLVN